MVITRHLDYKAKSAKLDFGNMKGPYDENFKGIRYGSITFYDGSEIPLHQIMITFDVLLQILKEGCWWVRQYKDEQKIDINEMFNSKTDLVIEDIEKEIKESKEFADNAPTDIIEANQLGRINGLSLALNILKSITIKED